jgi:carotenoid cleavage dioxygenase
VVGALVLPGCADDGPGAAGGRAAAGAGGATTAGSGPWWMHGNFGPVDREVTEHELEVEGALPPALTGLYVRNGSNPGNGPSPHWFLGDGMVHGVALDAGSARWYRNRWVQTPYLTEGGDLLNGGPPGGPRSQSNVSVVHHGGRLLTLGEVGLPYEIDAADLSTVGAYDFGGRLTTAMTAHPKIDPATGRMHFFGYGFVAPFLTYHVADADGTLVRSEEVAVAGPTMIHDFAITDQDAVFWELPVVFDLERAVQGEMPFLWRPGYGARLGVMPLDGPTAAIRWVEIEPCYVFHGVNAFREGGDVVIDVCRYPSMFDGSDLAGVPGELRRWRIDTTGRDLRVRDDVLTDRAIELPTIDRRLTGRPHRYGYFVETRDDDGVDFAGVVRRDARSGEEVTWDPGPGRHGGESVFVPDGDGARDDEGWLLVFVHDDADDATDLVVLDATEVDAGPAARVRMPERVPYGFHGTWVPA